MDTIYDGHVTHYNISEIEKYIYYILKSDRWENYWWGYNELQSDIERKYKNKYTLRELKSAMKKLKKRYIVKREITYYDDTHKVSGSGWFIR